MVANLSETDLEAINSIRIKKTLKDCLYFFYIQHKIVKKICNFQNRCFTLPTEL